MKLGIAGFGKMGQDIFNLLFDKLRKDQFVILEPYNTEKHAANLQKQLDRKHRRGLLTEQQLADRKQAVTFTADPGEFSGCDLVLEAIPESLAAKQALFARLTQIVPADCLLLYSGQDVITARWMIEHSDDNPELDADERAELQRRDLERLKQAVK